MTTKDYLKAAAFVAGTTLIGGAAMAEEFTMNAVSLAPRQTDVSRGFAMFIDEVDAEFEGEFKINWRGGPEVMPPFGQAEAVRNGAMDITFTSPSYHSGLVPASSTVNLSFKDCNEIRPTGYYERMTELHAEQDLVFLGEVPATDLAFHVFLNTPIETLADLDGLRIRVFPTLLPLDHALGAEPPVLPMGETYTAMERGTIDGFMRGTVGWLRDRLDGAPDPRGRANTADGDDGQPRIWRTALPEALSPTSYVRDEAVAFLDGCDDRPSCWWCPFPTRTTRSRHRAGTSTCTSRKASPRRLRSTTGPAIATICRPRSSKPMRSATGHPTPIGRSTRTRRI